MTVFGLISNLMRSLFYPTTTMHSPAPLDGLRLTIVIAGGGAGDSNDGMGGDATEELACMCNAMKALVIELAEQAHSLLLPEPLRLEGALADRPSPAT